MVLDINLFRDDKGGNSELIRESQRRRNASVELVDEVIKIDNEWKEARHQQQQLQEEANNLGREVGKLSKNKQPVPEETSKRQKELKKLIAETKILVQEKVKERETKLLQVGNIVHQDVTVADDEEHNEILRTWKPQPNDVRGWDSLDENVRLPHDQLLWRIGGFEPDAGNKIAGHRGYFLTGKAVLLQHALIRYAMDFLIQQEYEPIIPPFLMRPDIMELTAELEDFHEMLYKIVDTNSKTNEDELSHYLIATSEQPISALHLDKWINEKDFPKKYVGHSTCFRKEAGSAGRDNKGIFRVHQFEKVEQFILCAPDESWDIHRTMVENSEAFLQSLGIPYQVVVIVSSALNNAAAMKIDIEGYFPGYDDGVGAFKELVSCSNCTDYQSRRMKIRYGESKKKGEAAVYCHMLNGTMCATTRVLSILLEHYQTSNGVIIPEVLIPYMHLKENEEPFIPFVRPCKVYDDGKKKKGGKNNNN